jgi:hypothetical protein
VLLIESEIQNVSWNKKREKRKVNKGTRKMKKLNGELFAFDKAFAACSDVSTGMLTEGK